MLPKRYDGRTIHAQHFQPWLAAALTSPISPSRAGTTIALRDQDAAHGAAVETL